MEKDFITVSPDSGGGNATLNVTAAANSQASSRSTSITISGGGVSKKISISQSGLPNIALMRVGERMAQLSRSYKWELDSSILDKNGRLRVGYFDPGFVYKPISHYASNNVLDENFFIPLVDDSVVGRMITMNFDKCPDIQIDAETTVRALSALNIYSTVNNTYFDPYPFLLTSIQDLDMAVRRPFSMMVRVVDLTYDNQQELLGSITNPNFSLSFR